jgi:hypothetical protein
MDHKQDNLRLALWVAIGSLIAASVPIWPDGLYTLLRLVITGVALFTIYVLGTGEPKRTVSLVAVALLFNPIIPIYLSRLAWFPIDIGIAYWFWKIIEDHLSIDGKNDEGRNTPPEQPSSQQADEKDVE